MEDLLNRGAIALIAAAAILLLGDVGWALEVQSRNPEGCLGGQSPQHATHINVGTTPGGPGHTQGGPNGAIVVSGTHTELCPPKPGSLIPGQPGSCQNRWIRWPYPTDQPFEFATGVPPGLEVHEGSIIANEIMFVGWGSDMPPELWEPEIDNVAEVIGEVVIRLADPDGYHHWYNPPDAHPWWEYRPHWRVCEGRYRLRYGWVDPRPPVPPDFRPGQPGYLFIESLLKVHVPAISIGVSPRFDGLTGLETYYWVEGLGGDGTLTIGPEPFRDLMVEVKASASQFRWEFGDDAGGTYYTVGKPYPSRSEIRHTYRTKSSRHPHAEQDGTYLVTVDGTLDVEFRVFQAGQTPGADEGWVTRPPITVSASRSYRVVEVVGVLTR